MSEYRMDGRAPLGAEQARRLLEAAAEALAGAVGPVGRVLVRDLDEGHVSVRSVPGLATPTVYVELE